AFSHLKSPMRPDVRHEAHGIFFGPPSQTELAGDACGPDATASFHRGAGRRHGVGGVRHLVFRGPDHFSTVAPQTISRGQWLGVVAASGQEDGAWKRYKGDEEGWRRHHTMARRFTQMRDHRRRVRIRPRKVFRNWN